MKRTHRRVALLLLAALCALGLPACQTQQQMAARGVGADLPFFLCQTQQMQQQLAEHHKGNFDAESRYADYLKHHGDKARKLRDAAAEAVRMRFHLESRCYKVDEYLWLTPREVRQAKEIMATLEETPPYDKTLWLQSEYDKAFGPQPAPPIYWDLLEFVAADGKVTSYYSWGNEGDADKAEEYRTARFRPFYMLPKGKPEQWKKMSTFQRMEERKEKLFH